MIIRCLTVDGVNAKRQNAHDKRSIANSRSIHGVQTALLHSGHRKSPLIGQLLS